MRFVGLGQWLYFVWHLPALLLCLGAVALGAVMARSLRRDALPVGARELRWNVLGWSAVAAATLSVVVWPYLVAVASIRVAPDGAWRVTNYLGVPLAEIPAHEPRVVRAQDLGGLHWGLGRIQIVRASGEVLTSVRVSGRTFERARRALGYPDAMLRDRGTAMEIAAHVYTPRGPFPHGDGRDVRVSRAEPATRWWGP